MQIKFVIHTTPLLSNHIIIEREPLTVRFRRLIIQNRTLCTLMFVGVNSTQPWNSVLPTLSLLHHCKTANDVNQLHARIITTGLIHNASLTTKLILTFSSSQLRPLVQFGRYIFMSEQAFCNHRNKEDPFLWNAVMKTYSHGDYDDDPKQALVLFCLMLQNGVCVDEYSVSLALKACSRLGLVKEGMQIHGLMWKMENGFDLFLENCLIGLYLRCGCVGFARNLFDRMLDRDSVSYNSMIDGYVKCGMVNLARELFNIMPKEERNLITWNSMINGYAQSLDELKVAWELFEEMPERDLVSWNSLIDGCLKCGKMEDAHALFCHMPTRDVVSWANMINGYAKLGSVDTARRLFEEMPKRDVIACNAMITGYVQNGYCKEAFDIFHNMQSESNLSPDTATLLIVLSAIAQLGHLNEGVAIHCYIEENGHSYRGKLGVALIDMYAKCGSIDNAMRVFEDIKEKNVDHWNAVIGGLAIHGFGELAFEMFMEMKRLSVKPDDITFIGLLNACGHAGLVKEGLMCFEIMRRVYTVEPKLQHYGCMVDILGRAGHIEEAIKFIEEMPIEPNDVIWRTLLSACKNHENLNIGEPVAEQLIRMDSCNSSPYVLLSNMYAGFTMWNDVSRVRTLMKERNLKKIPGCSWIELEGVVHEFFVKDKSHSQVREIHSMLDSLCTLNSEITGCR